MATINLAPSTHYIAVARQRRRILFASSGALILLLFLGWLGFFLTVKSSEGRLNDVQAQTASVQTQVASAQQDVNRIVAFEDRLKALDVLLHNRTTVMPIYKELEKLLPPAAVITHLDVSLEKNEVAVTGQAPSLDDIAQTAASLERLDSPVFQSATIQQMQRKGGTNPGETPYYNFQMTVRLKPQALQAASPIQL